MKVELHLTVLLCVVLVDSTGWRSKSSSKSAVGSRELHDRSWSSDGLRRNDLFSQEKFTVHHQPEGNASSRSFERKSVAFQNTETYKPRIAFMNRTLKDNQDFKLYYGKPKIQKLDAKTEKKFLLTKLRSIARALLSLGLISPCSHVHKKNFDAIILKMVELIFQTVWTNEDTFYTRAQDRMGKLLVPQIFKNSLPDNCGRTKEALEATAEDLKVIVSNLDDGLVFFLNNELNLISSRWHFSLKHMSIFLRLAEQACRSWASRNEKRKILCAEKLQSLHRALGSLLKEFEITENNTKRKKRSLEILSNSSSIYEKRRGDRQYDNGYFHSSESYGHSYGGYGHGNDEYGYGNRYKDDSANLIVIPVQDNTDDYDKKLIKLIGALAIGTYAILGTLVLKTLLHYLFSRGREGPSGDKGDSGIKGMKGILGMPGDKGMPGVKGTKGMKGPDGINGTNGTPGAANTVPGPAGPAGNPGVAGESGDKGANGDGGEKGASGADGPSGPTGDKGGAGDPAVPPRTLFSEKFFLNRKKRNLITENLSDVPALLHSIYNIRRREENRMHSSKTITDVVTRLNHLWSVYRDPVACGKCSLFDFLQEETVDNLDSYILAGFAHVLGDSGSLQLLDQVRRARRAGATLRCRRSKDTCDLEASSIFAPKEGSVPLLRETY